MNMHDPPNWAHLAETFIGPAHARNGLPNQDSVATYSRKGATTCSIVAVADGHGSKRCSRSHVGSKLAVEVAIDVGIEFLNLLPADVSSVEVKNRVSRLPIDIVKDWQERVKRHRKCNAVGSDETDEFIAYGTTLLVVIVHEKFYVCLQLGDGNIRIVSRDGEVNSPFTSVSVEDQIGEETDSLCQENAHKKFKQRLQILDNENCVPVLFLLCSDGYSNAFPNDDEFAKNVGEMATMLRDESKLGIVRTQLRGWIEENGSYSGDDGTVGLIFDVSPSEKKALDEEIEESPRSPMEPSQNDDVQNSAKVRAKAQDNSVLNGSHSLPATDVQHPKHGGAVETSINKSVQSPCIDDATQRDDMESVAEPCTQENRPWWPWGRRREKDK